MGEQLTLALEAATATCRNGHDLTTAGTYQRRDGTKTCRDCIRERDRRRTAAKNAARAAKNPPRRRAARHTARRNTLLAAPVAEGHDHDTGQRWTIDEWRAEFPQTWEQLAASPVILHDLEHF